MRLEVSEQWRVNVGQFTLSLAEMQVFEKGVNVAEGTEVTASDVFGGGAFSRRLATGIPRRRL